MICHINRSIAHLLKYCMVLFVCLQVHANPNTFEVGAENISGTTAATGFINITFDTPFEILPLVFVLGAVNGGHPCDARVTNVTLTSFDVACVEASNDGRHASMAIQYLAVTPGVHTIPTSTGGSVVFEAGSIDTQTQQYNYTCPPGDAATDCVTEGFDVITPVTPFATTPSILGQVQTSNSESGAPPGTNSDPFLTAAFRISETTPSMFGLALERSEDIDGAVVADETIAWLAVEDTNGCETLDFSAKGGPAAVNFQAIVTDDQDSGSATDTDGFNALDGWDDGGSAGCNAGEGASFEAACFTITPVVLANKRSRNEADGGWVRQCLINTGEVRLTIDEDQEGDNERNHANESASIIAFGAAFSTPVTMSLVSVKANQTLAAFTWQTVTETFNIGFNLWGEYQGKWVKLNGRMIPSLARDKLKPSDYKKTIRFRNRHRGQITKFGVSSLDVNGKEEFFGPFFSGESYGEQAIPEPIDWHKVREQYTQRMLDRGYVFTQGRWRRPSLRGRVNRGGLNTVKEWLDIHIDKPGVYVVTFDDVMDAGLNLAGARIADIALTFKGQPLSRRIVSDDGLFNTGDLIQFIATNTELAKHDALYINERVFQLQQDRTRALNMNVTDYLTSSDVKTLIQEGAQLGNSYLYRNQIGEDKFYSELSPTDPWLDAEIFSYGSATEKTYQILMPDTIIADTEGLLSLDLAGGIDYPGVDPDHHLQVYVNDQLVFDQLADGFLHWQIDIPIAKNIIIAGDNAVRLVLPADTAYPVDIINVNTVELAAQVPIAAANAEFNISTGIDFASTQGVEVYEIKASQLDSKATVFAFDQQGNASHIQSIVKRQDSLFIPALAMQDKLDALRYWVGGIDKMQSPALLKKTTAKSLLVSNVDYLVIAHPSFIGAELDDYILYKNQQGLRTKVIDYADIVEQFGYGMNTPDALRRYLIAENARSRYRYVLLVGGHSYDYLDHLDTGAMSFIPTYYRPIDLIQYAPTDTPFIELNNDGRPDKALGRWPVRTLADLRNIIRKTKEWDLHQMNQERSALLIAEQAEGNTQFDESLELATASTIGKWNDVTRVYLDDVFALPSSNGLADARKTIIERINQGVGLTMFNGHGSPSSWTFQSLISWQHIADLENYGKPTVVMPLACYTTYYETPSVNSLAHQWLFKSDAQASQGAAAIHGAMVLGDFRENAKFAKQVLRQQTKRNVMLGDAILRAKRSLKPWNQMVNNWALLGDPTLRMAQ